MIPPTHQAKKIPGRQQGQGHEVVQNEQGEGYQQPDLDKNSIFLL